MECKQCKDGYKVHIGQCVKDCVSTHGLSLTNKNICLACSDKNCVDCSQNQTVCKKCNILTALAKDGKCKSTFCLMKIPVKMMKHLSTTKCSIQPVFPIKPNSAQRESHPIIKRSHF